MTPKEQYIAYISKHKLTGKAVPFTVAFDNNGDCWIVQLDNLQKVETDTNGNYTLNIPSFIKGFMPVDYIFSHGQEPGRISLTVIDDQFQNIIPKHGEQETIENLAEIETIENLAEIQKQLSAERMRSIYVSHQFIRCRHIKNLTINGNGIQLKGNLKGIFSNLGCETIRFIEFNASHIECFKNMFSNGLFTEIDLSGFIQSKVNNINAMFMKCENLKRLDMRNLIIQPLEIMSWTFYGCTQLEELMLPKIRFTSNALLPLTFEGCKNLDKVNLENLKTDAQIELRDTFEMCKPHIMHQYIAQRTKRSKLKGEHSDKK